MNYKKLMWVFTFAVAGLLSGCAPISANLTNSEKFVSRPPSHLQKYDFKLVILNNAAKIDPDKDKFHRVNIPVYVQEMPAITVEKDIRRYFDQVLSESNNDRHIVVHIDNAEAYWISAPLNVVPLSNMYSSAAGYKPFVMNIKITVEVEEEGKVVSTFKIDRKFTVPDGSMATLPAMEESYQRLIEMYRKTMYESLEQEFVPGYLANPATN